MGSKAPQLPPNDGRQSKPSPPPPRPPRPARKNAWEIAEDWYRESDIAHSIQYSRSIAYDGEKIPVDVYSPEFAKWLTNQYRLAMAKGIQLGREGSDR